MAQRVVLASEVPTLEALGAAGALDFQDGGARLATGARVQRLQAEPGRTLLRVPLPGTPDASGRRLELPRGAGTGWLRAHVYERGALSRFASRWGAPPSSSPAARRWNLLCHLRAQGVGAPRPLALLEAGRGLRQVSVCVEAELAGFEPLPRWLARARGAARGRGLRSVGLALAALDRSGVRLARGRAEHVLVQSDLEADADDDCAALSIARLREESGLWRDRGLARARLPAVAFDDLDGARLRRQVAAAERCDFVSRLGDDLRRNCGLVLTRREELHVLAACGWRDAAVGGSSAGAGSRGS
jgi:hypothetical protein